jgi:hypothetical protein
VWHAGFLRLNGSQNPIGCCDLFNVEFHETLEFARVDISGNSFEKLIIPLSLSNIGAILLDIKKVDAIATTVATIDHQLAAWNPGSVSDTS